MTRRSLLAKVSAIAGKFAELRQLCFGVGLKLHNDAGRVLLQQAVQHGLLGAVALVVDRGAIQGLLGLPADGLHARLPR